MSIETGKRYRFKNRYDGTEWDNGVKDEFENAVVSVAEVVDSPLVQIAYGEIMYRVVHSVSGNTGLAFEDELEAI